MSDDRVVSLEERRPPSGGKILGILIFPNDQLRMPMKHGATGPVWTIEPVDVQLDGREELTTVFPRFGMIDHSPDGTSGYCVEHEEGVSADFYFERDLFLALQSAAFSSMPLTLFITFRAENSSPPSLMLAIERRTA